MAGFAPRPTPNALGADSQMNCLFVKLHWVKPLKRSVRAKTTTKVWLSRLHAAPVSACLLMLAIQSEFQIGRFPLV